MRVCNICNTKNDDNKKYCTRCGNNLLEMDNSDKYRELNKHYYSHLDEDTKTIFKVAICLNIIASAILIYILYKDIGFYVLLVPLFLFGTLAILYIKERIKNNSFRN